MNDAVIMLLFFAAAVLYSSVGHSGASGYLAVMALMGVEGTVMKPVALAVNVLVASIAAVQFVQARRFSWSLFWPFGLASIPLAYLGGTVELPGEVYRPVAGAALLFAAYRLWKAEDRPSEAKVTAKTRPLVLSLVAGAAIGFLSGLIGIGGSVFLGPLLLFTGWSNAKEAAGVSAAFNLVNSASGLSGYLADFPTLPSSTPLWALSAGLGGLIGSGYGSRRLANQTSRRLLSVVLVLAGLKLLLA